MPDTTPPTFDHADLQSNGLSLYVYFAETVSLPMTHGSEDPFFTIKVDGIARSYVAPVGWSFLTSLKAAVVQLASAAYAGQTLTVSLLGTIQDSVGNTAVHFTDQAVNNLSEVLPVPANLAATAGDNSVALSWDAIDPDEDGVRFERSTDGITYAAIHDKSGSGTTYTDDTAINGTKYWYRIKSFTTSPANESLPSNVVLIIPAPATVSGRYADSDDLDDLRGSLNITTWSDLNNTGDRDTNRIQRAFDQTDSDIEKALEHLYTIPLAVTGNDAEILRQWSTVLASHWLYRNRGQYDQPDNANAQAGNLYDAQRKEVMAEISKYRDGQRYRLNAARRNSDNASTPTGPAIIRNPIGPYNPRYLDHEHNR